MKTRLVLWILGLVTVLFQTSVYASPPPPEGTDSVVVALSVSAQQDENFNAFTAWLRAHRSLKQNSNLQSAYKAVFAALKKNDYPTYTKEIDRLNSALTALRVQETTDMQQFFQTLSLDSSPTAPIGGGGSGGGSCQVSCLFGSCSINCPSGTKPKCFCQGGNPQCGCEPYSQQ